MEKVKERNSNHELMRIISMFFIVIGHVLTHGAVITNCQNEFLTNVINIIVFIIIVHVNSFILVTGYYQCKKTFKQSAVWKLMNAALFYRILIAGVLSILGYISITKGEWMKQAFPLNMTMYWFVNAYFILYCISPFLNKLINSLNKKDFKILLLVGFVIMSIIPTITNNGTFNNNGHTVYNFIYLYFIGAYLRNYPLDKEYIFAKLSKNAYRFTLIFIFFFCAFSQYILFSFVNSLGYMNSVVEVITTYIRNSFINVDLSGYNYSNPLIMIQSIAYFAFFTTLTLKSKFINRVATLVFGVYLIHENTFFRPVLYNNILHINNGPIYSSKFIFTIFIASISLYIACLIIEFIRQVIFKFIYNRKISKKIRDGYYNWLHSFYIKD